MNRPGRPQGGGSRQGGGSGLGSGNGPGGGGGQGGGSRQGGTRRSGEKAPDSERLRQLMMAEVDEEISPEARAELESELAADPDLPGKLETFRQLKEVTGTMTPIKPPREMWDGYWEDIYRRMERGIGWALASLGAVVVGSWALWNAVTSLIADSELPVLVRWSLLALLTGVMVLFVSVLRERLFMRKRENSYKDVIR